MAETFLIVSLFLRKLREIGQKGEAECLWSWRVHLLRQGYSCLLYTSGETVEILDRKFDFTCVSMGNPHAVTFVENVMEYPIEKYGRVSEFHPIFPDRVNTEFVEIVDDSHVKMRVWERGSGETWARCV